MFKGQHCKFQNLLIIMQLCYIQIKEFILFFLDIDQLKCIFQILGTPQDPTLMTLCSTRVLKYIQSWPKYEKIPLKKTFPNASSQGEFFLRFTWHVF
jgi:hypothetical protein